MPATYLSYEFEPGMTLAEKQNKLYLGVISAGEQAYTLGAAIAECRKQLVILDELVSEMRVDYETLKTEFRSEQASPTPDKCPTCGSKDYWTALPACHGGIPDSWHSSAPKGTK